MTEGLGEEWSIEAEYRCLGNTDARGAAHAAHAVSEVIAMAIGKTNEGLESHASAVAKISPDL